MNEQLPALPEGFQYRLDLGRAATPRMLKQRPIHRWFYFPHSYSPELVEAVLDGWKLPSHSRLLDPFVGAGTTLLVARDRGYDGLGLDVLPLAVLVSNAKVSRHDSRAINAALSTMMSIADSDKEFPGAIPPRLARALTENEYRAFWQLQQAARSFDEPVRGFMLVGLLGILPQFSRAVADGGWFRWVEKPDRGYDILGAFQSRVKQMMEEIEQTAWTRRRQKKPGQAMAVEHDARQIHLLDHVFDGLITSPPYPNRHDYTRVLQIELLILGCAESDIFRLRRHALRSHVEAQPPENPAVEGYSVPNVLQECLDRLPGDVDQRIPRMLRGYCQDMYLVLRSAKARMKAGGKLALVVGNVRHAGEIFPVDEILVAVGKMAGMECNEVWVIRLRGNSAQQMGKYGRVASRESVVFFDCLP